MSNLTCLLIVEENNKISNAKLPPNNCVQRSAAGESRMITSMLCAAPAAHAVRPRVRDEPDCYACRCAYCLEWVSEFGVMLW
jgi:hypothetical protein